MPAEFTLYGIRTILMVFVVQTCRIDLLFQYIPLPLQLLC